MDVVFALLAEAANTDGKGRLNVLGIFNSVTAETFPARQERMALALHLKCTAAEYGQEKDLEILLMRDNEKKPTARLVAKLQVPKPEVPTIELMPIIDINGLEFDAPGHYTFRIFIGSESKAQIPFTVVEVPKENGS